MPYNFTADSFHTKKLCTDFLRANSIFFVRKTKKLSSLEAPFGGLGATYAVHLRLIGKLLGDFLLVIIELFFARCFRFVTIHAFDRRTDGRTLIGKTALHTMQRGKKGDPSVESADLTNNLQ